jgi:hypothetical protein
LERGIECRNTGPYAGMNEIELLPKEKSNLFIIV